MADTKKKKPVPWANRITNIQGKVLENLGKYKFLTLSQLLELNVGTTQYRYLWKQVASLRDRNKPLVACKSFNTEDRLGRVEDMYYLTKEGKESLILDLHVPAEEIRMPLGRTIAYKDYYHRKYTIDFQILLSKWVMENGFTVPFFHTYFDKSGNNRTAKDLRAKTKVEFGDGGYIIPDAAFQVDAPDKERFFFFEMHNGRDTKRLLAQLHNHARGLVEMHTHKTYDLNPEKAYHTLFVFEHESIKNAFIHRLLKEGHAFQQIQQFFLCKSLEDLKEASFESGWVTIYGEPIELTMS